MIRLFFLALLAQLSLLSADFYPKTDVCRSLGIDTENIQTAELKSVCVDFIPTSLQKQTVMEAIDNAGEDFGYIVEELRKNNIPDAVIFLAVTESNFSTRYANKRRYAGVWQLSKFEAKLFGLEVNQKNRVDERRDIQKSTSVIITILKNNYAEFGSWPLAMMAYNAGEFRLKNAIKRAKTDDLEVLLYKKKNLLPRTTSNYIKRIIIYASTANYPPVYDRINSVFRTKVFLEDRNETNSSN